MRQLAAPQAQRTPPTAQVMTTLEAAERSAASAVAVGRDIDRRFGLNDRQERARLGSRIDEMRAGLDVMAHQQLGGVETRIQQWEQDLDRAKQLLETGHPDQAAEIFRRTQRQVEHLPEAISAVRQINVAGLPNQLSTALLSDVTFALNAYGAGQTERGDAMMRGVNMFLSNRDFLMSRDGAQALGALGSAVNFISQGQTMDAQGLAEAGTRLDNVENGIRSAQDDRRTRAAWAFGREGERIEELAQGTTGPLRDAGLAIMRDIGDMETRLREHPEQVTDEEMRRLAMRVNAYKLAVTELNDTPEAIRPQAQAVFVSAINMLARGGSYGDFNVMMFAAEEIRNHPDRASANFRRDVVAQAAAATREGMEPADVQTAMGTLRGTLSRSLSGELNRAAERESGQTATLLQGISGRLGAESTADDLQRARAAVEIEKSMNARMGRGSNVADPVRQGATTIYNRGLTLLSSGGDPRIAMAQSSLAEMYISGDENKRRDAEALSHNLETQGPEYIQAVMLYIDGSNRAAEFRAELPRLPAEARPGMERAIAELERINSRLAAGQEPATQEEIDATRQRMAARMGSDPQYAAVMRGRIAEARRDQSLNLADDEAAITYLAHVDANAAVQQRADDLMATGTAMVTTIRNNRGDRAALGQIFTYSIDATIAGRLDDGTAYRNAATTYTKLTTTEDKRGLLEACRQMSAGELERTAAGRVLAVYEQRGIYESALVAGRNYRAIINSRAYFDLALRAARSEDPTAYNAVFDMAVTYARMASVPADRLTPERQTQRTEAMNYVEGQLGNYFGSRDFRISGRRISQIGTTWRADLSRVTDLPIPRAILSGGSVAQALGGGTDQAATDRGLNELNTRQGAITTHLRNSEDLEFLTTGVFGRSDAQNARSEAAWRREAARLHRQGDLAHARGDQVAERFYRRQEALADPAFMGTSRAAAERIYFQGRAEQNAALTFSTELNNVDSAPIADVNRRIGELIPQLPPQMQARANRLREEAGTDEGRTRQLYRFLLQQQVLQHSQNGELLIRTATGIRDGVASLDTSMTSVASRHRESGRFDATVAVRTFIGLGTGQRVNLLGEPVDEQGHPYPPGQAPPTPAQGAPIPVINPDRFLLAQRTLQVGTAVINQELSKTRQTQSLVAQGRQLQAQNVETIKGLINQMIDRVEDPATREGFRQNLTDAGNDLALLQEVYRQVGYATNTRTTDDSGHDYYDASQHDRNATSGINLAYAERFDASNSMLRRTRLGIRAASGRQQVWIDDANFRRQYGEMSPDNPFIGVVSTEAPVSQPGQTTTVPWLGVTPRPEVIDTLISHLPPSSEREQLRQRLSNIPAGPEGDAQRQGMMDELLNREVYDPNTQRQRRMGDVVGGGDLFYYHAVDYDGRFARNQALIESGQYDAAEAGLGQVEGEMSRAAAITRQDVNVTRTTIAAWSSRNSANHAGDEFQEAMPTDEDDVRGRGEVEDRNNALQQPISYLAGSMRRDGGDWDSARAANEDARDRLLAGGSILQVNPYLAMVMIEGIPADRMNEIGPNGRTYAQMHSDLLASMTGTPDWRRAQQLSGEIYGALSSNAADFRSGLNAARQSHLQGWDSSIDAQLEAAATTLEVGARHQQRVVGWEYARKFIRAGQQDLRSADQSQRYRLETSEEMRDEERAHGWAPHRYTDEAYREFAARRFEGAMAATSEQNDFRFYDMLVRNEAVAAPIYEFRGQPREWHDDSRHGGYAYITVYSDLRGNFGMGGRGGRSIGFADELGGLNYREARELTSFADDDIWDHVRPVMEQRAEDRTTLELATLGVGRVWHGNDGSLSTTHAEGEGYWGLSRLHNTPQQTAALNEAYSQFMQLDGEVESVIFAHDSPWGADPQQVFFDRMSARQGSARDSGLSAIGRLNIVPVSTATGEIQFEAPDLDRSATLLASSVPFVQNQQGQWVDTNDQTTVDARASMGRYRSAYRVTVAVGKFAVATVGIVAAPATGGASLVLTAGVGAMGIAEGIEQREQMGKWTAGSIFTVSVGVVTTVLPFAGELAAAGRGAAALNEAATLMNETEQAVNAARLAGASRATIEAINTWTEGTSAAAQATRTLSFGQRAWQLAWGAEDLSIAQRAIHLTGNALAVSGAGQFAYQMPSMIRSVQNGDMTWWEASFYGFQTVIQPLVAARYAQLRSAPGEEGIPRYVPRWRQVIEAGLLGVPMQSGEVHAMALDYSRLQGEIGRMPIAERTTYRASLGDRPLAPSIERGVLSDYNATRAAGGVRNFEEYAASPAGRRTIESARSENNYQAFERAMNSGGVRSIEEFERSGNNGQPFPLDNAQRAYIRARLGGAEPADAFTASTRAAAPPAPQAQPRTRMESLRAAAETRRTEADMSAFRARVESANFTSRAVAPDGQATYTIGRGEEAITYTQQHVETASDMIFHTERILRENPDFASLPEARRNEILANVPERIRSQVSDLVFDPEFARAARAQGGPDTPTELRLALGKASYVADIAADPRVMDAGYATEVRPVIESPELVPRDLAEHAEGRRNDAQGMRDQAFELRRDAQSTVHSDVERQGMLESATALENRATALEHSADRIDAAYRRRATPADIRERAAGARAEARGLHDQAEQTRSSFREEETRLANDPELLARRRSQMEEDVARIEARAAALEDRARGFDSLAREREEALAPTAPPAAHEEGRTVPRAPNEAVRQEAQPLTAQQQARAQELMSARGMSREAAEAFVRDEAARPNAVPLAVEEHLGEQGFQGMPTEYQSRRITLRDGSTTTLSEAPRARLLRRIDNTEDSVGSTAGVWEAEIMVDGQPRRVAVKVFKDPFNRGQPPTAEQWENLFGFVTGRPAAEGRPSTMGEAGNLDTIGGMTYRSPDGRELPVGPGFYRFVNVDGNIAIAMDLLPGMYIGDMNPTQIREFVRPETYQQIQRIGETLEANGYGMHDFQFIVVFPPEAQIPTGLSGAARRQFIENWHTTINGREVRAGDVVLMDAGGLYRAADEPHSTFSPTREADSARWTGNNVLINDHLARLTATATDAAAQPQARAQAQADLRAMEGFMREVEPNVRAEDPMGEVTRRYMLVGNRETRAAARLDEIRQTDPARAQEIEGAFRRFERDTGIPEGTLLPVRAGEVPAAAVREGTTGLPVEEQPTLVPTRPPEGQPVARRAGPEEVTTPGGRRVTPTATPEEVTTPGGRRRGGGGEGAPPAFGEGGGGPVAAPRGGGRGGPAARGEEIAHNVEDITTAEVARQRAQVESGMPPQSREVLDVAEALMGKRGDMSRTDARARLQEWEAARDPRAAAVERLTSTTSTVSRIFETASPVERAIFADEIARAPEGEPVERTLERAYDGIARMRPTPDTSAEMLAQARELGAMPDSAQRIEALKRTGRDELAGALDLAMRTRDPQVRERIGNEWEASRVARRREDSIAAARSARRPEDVAASDVAAIREFGRSRNMDPDLVDSIAHDYGQGGAEGRLRVLDGMGVRPFAAQRDSIARNEQIVESLQQRVNDLAPDDPARAPLERELNNRRTALQTERATLEANANGLFDLVVRGNLQQRIAGLPGFEDATITGVTHLGGLRGIYRVELSGGRHLFVKAEDVAPAAFGARMAQAEGLMSSGIHSGFSYDTGVAYTDPITGAPAQARQEFGIIEDIRTLVGRDVEIRLPDGRVQTQRVEGIEMVTDILAHPDPNNPVHRAFYELLSTPQGRQRIAEAWRAYQEMSRRAGLMDRYRRNSAFSLSRGSDNQVNITFQPIDTDGVGTRIYSRPETGRTDLSVFNRDFADGTAAFMLDLTRASQQAQGIGGTGGPLMQGGAVSLSQLHSDFFSPQAERGARLPADTPEMRARANAEIQSYDGQPFGIGFNAYNSAENPNIGDMVLQGGRLRIVERADGRVAMHADEQARVSDQLAAGQGEFVAGQRDMVNTELSTRITGVAERIARGESVSRDTPGYEIAEALARDPAFAGADQAARREMAARAIESATGEAVRPGAPAHEPSAPEIEIVEGEPTSASRRRGPQPPPLPQEVTPGMIEEVQPAAPPPQEQGVTTPSRGRRPSPPPAERAAVREVSDAEVNAFLARYREGLENAHAINADDPAFEFSNVMMERYRLPEGASFSEIRAANRRALEDLRNPSPELIAAAREVLARRAEPYAFEAYALRQAGQPPAPAAHEETTTPQRVRPPSPAAHEEVTTPARAGRAPEEAHVEPQPAPVVHERALSGPGELGNLAARAINNDPGAAADIAGINEAGRNAIEGYRRTVDGMLAQGTRRHGLIEFSVELTNAQNEVGGVSTALQWVAGAPGPGGRPGLVEFTEVYTNNAAAGHDDAVALFNKFPPEVQGLIRDFIAQRAGAHDETALARDFSGRITNEIQTRGTAASDEFFARYGIRPNAFEALAMRNLGPRAVDALMHFHTMPPEVQRLVGEFITARPNAFDEDALAQAYSQHIHGAFEAQGVQATYEAYRQSGNMPADPVEALTIRYLTQNGTVSPETLPHDQQMAAYNQAVEFRAMAREYAAGGRPITDVSDLALAARQAAPPTQMEAAALGYGNARNAAAAYRFVNDAARARAAQNGRPGSPTPEDYMFGAMLARTVGTREQPPARVEGVIGAFDPVENQGTPQAGIRAHVDVAVSTPDGVNLYVRVFSDRVTVIGADPQGVIGRAEWPGPDVQAAYIRYAQTRYGQQLNDAFEAAGRFIDDAAFRPESGVGRNERTAMLARARSAIEGHPDLVPARMGVDQITDAFQTNDGAARSNAESGFRRLDRAHQDQVITELRFFGRRAEADYLSSIRRPEPADVVEAYRSGNPARVRQAQEDFARMPIERQQETLAQMRSQGLENRAGALAGRMIIDHFSTMDANHLDIVAQEFSRLQPEQQEAVVGELHRRGLHEGATYLNELGSLSRGPVGDAIGRIYGIGRNELTQIYANANNIQEARGALARRLGIELEPFAWANMPDRSWVSEPYRGFNRPEDDHFLFGMLLSGDMPGHVADIIRGMYPPGENAVGRIHSIEFHNGAVGAYEVRVEVTRQVERPGGVRENVTEMRTLYVKRQNLLPDAAGAEYSRATGIPAPEIHTATAEGDMRYTMADGTGTRYGILESMGDFRGTIRRGNLDIEVRARAEMGIRQVLELRSAYETLRTSTNEAERAQAQQMIDRFTPQQIQLYERVMGTLTSPDQAVRARFWEELGFTLTGSYAIGLWDRHEINLRVMDLEITQPLSDAQIAQMRREGTNVVRDPDGTLRIENPTVGGIDTDAAGVYMAQEIGGNYWFGNMNHRFGNTDLHRMFDVLSHVTGRSVPDLVHEAFGNVQISRDPHGAISITGDFNGGMAAGGRRFWTEFGNNATYRADITRRFNSHAGEPMGMGYPLGPVEIGMIRSPGGAAQFNSPQSGDPISFVIYDDGRSENRPSYEISYGSNLANIHPGILNMFRPGEEMLVFQVTPEIVAALPPEAGPRVGVIDYTGAGGAVVKRVGVIAANDPLAVQLQEAGVPLIRARRDIPPSTFAANRTELPPEVFTLGILRGDPGFSELTGINSTAVGPVPVFNGLMHAGQGFMNNQFVEIGGWILDRENAVRPNNPPPQPAPGNLHPAAPADAVAAPHPVDPQPHVSQGNINRASAPPPPPGEIPGTPGQAQPVPPQGGPGGTIRMGGAPPVASPGRIEVHGSDLIHPMSAQTYESALTAAPLNDRQRGYVRGHFTGEREPFELAVGNAVGIIKGLENINAIGTGPLEVRGYYDRTNGRVVQVGEGEVPPEQRANAVEFTLTIDRQTGRITAVTEPMPRLADLGDLVGLQVMEGGGRGGGGGGRPPGGGGPGPRLGPEDVTPVVPVNISQIPTPRLDMNVPEQRGELASRLASTDPEVRRQAVNRFNSLPTQQEKDMVGADLAISLRLGDVNGLAQFARRVMPTESGAVRDQEATDQLAMLPQPVRDAVNRLAGSRRFRNNAQTPEALNRYLGERREQGIRGPGYAQVEGARMEINGAVDQILPTQQAEAANMGIPQQQPPLRVVGREVGQPAQPQEGMEPARAMGSNFFDPGGPFRRHVERSVIDGPVMRDDGSIRIRSSGGGGAPQVLHVSGMEGRAANEITLDRGGQVEIGRRIIAGDEIARARFNSLPPEQQQQIVAATMEEGVTIEGRQLRITSEEDVSAFARAVVRGDPQAVALREIMPEAMRSRFDALIADPALRMQAVIEPHYADIIPMIGRPGGMAELDAYLQRNAGIAPADLASAREMVLGSQQGREAVLNMARRTLNLEEPEGIADFARRLIANDPAAVERFNLLPRVVRGQIEQFRRNPNFLTQESKLRAAAGRVSNELLDMELRMGPEPAVAPGSTLERARDAGLRDLRRVNYYDQRLSEITVEEGGRLVVRDESAPGRVYRLNEAMLWEVTDPVFGTRAVRTSESGVLSFVLAQRYAAYRDGIYNRVLENEFNAQSQYRTIEEYRQHIESAIPQQLRTNFGRFGDINDSGALLASVMDFVRSAPNTRLTDAQMQFIANRISEQLGVGAVDITAMRVGDVRMQDLAGQVVRMAEAVVHDNSGRNRVYLWRDGGGFMAADAVLSQALGIDPPRGVLLNRVAFGQAGVGRTAAGRVDPVEATAFFDRTVGGMVETARQESASASGDRFASFNASLVRQIVARRASDPQFDAACTQMLGYLERSGVINPGSPVVFDGVLVDSSSRTLLPFTKALLESVYGERVHVDIQYFHVASGYEFLPNYNTPQQLIDNVESAGANNSFIRNNQDYGRLDTHGGVRMRDSLMYFLMLRNQAIQGNPQ